MTTCTPRGGHGLGSAGGLCGHPPTPRLIAQGPAGPARASIPDPRSLHHYSVSEPFNLVFLQPQREAEETSQPWLCKTGGSGGLRGGRGPQEGEGTLSPTPSIPSPAKPTLPAPTCRLHGGHGWLQREAPGREEGAHGRGWEERP